MSRAGRKRKAGPRFPGGRVKQSRPETREEAISVAIGARQRVFDVSPTIAAEMSETSFLGRLLATDELSERQFKTAREYQAIIAEYDRMHPTRGFPEAANLDRGGGFDDSDGTDPAYVKKFRGACDKEQTCRGALFEASREDARVPGVVFHVVIQDFYQPHMIGPLRVGLNALANALDIPRELPASGVDNLIQAAS